MKFLYKDVPKIVELKDLKEDLIKEIKRDTLENIADESIVENNMNLLQKVFENENRIGYVNFLIEQLELFGYEIMEIYILKEDLKALYNYYKNYNFGERYTLLMENLQNIIDDLEDNVIE